MEGFAKPCIYNTALSVSNTRISHGAAVSSKSQKERESPLITGFNNSIALRIRHDGINSDFAHLRFIREKGSTIDKKKI